MIHQSFQRKIFYLGSIEIFQNELGTQKICRNCSEAPRLPNTSNVSFVGTGLEGMYAPDLQNLHLVISFKNESSNYIRGLMLE